MRPGRAAGIREAWVSVVQPGRAHREALRELGKRGSVVWPGRMCAGQGWLVDSIGGAAGWFS
jgi:hypothetical protein